MRKCRFLSWLKNYAHSLRALPDKAFGKIKLKIAKNSAKHLTIITTIVINNSRKQLNKFPEITPQSISIVSFLDTFNGTHFAIQDSSQFTSPYLQEVEIL